MKKVIRNVSIVICLGFTVQSIALQPSNLHYTSKTSLFPYTINQSIKDEQKKSILKLDAVTSLFEGDNYVYCTRCRPPLDDCMQ